MMDDPPGVDGWRSQGGYSMTTLQDSEAGCYQSIIALKPSYLDE